MPCERSHCTATLEPVDGFKVNGTQPGLCIAYEQWLGVLQARLRGSRLHGFWDDTFLYVPEYKLTLTFDEGSRRAILFGAAPPNVIHACRVQIDGDERVVMSPGLPEYDRIISRCQKVDPQADLQTARPSSTIPLGTFGLLMSLITYLLYVVLR